MVAAGWASCPPFFQSRQSCSSSEELDRSVGADACDIVDWTLGVLAKIEEDPSVREHWSGLLLEAPL